MLFPTTKSHVWGQAPFVTLCADSCERGLTPNATLRGI